MIVQIPKVQTILVHVVTKEISQTLKSDIKIDAVDIRFLNKAVLKGVLVMDQHKDTLLYTHELVAAVNKIDRKKKSISLNRATLNGAQVNFLSDSSKTMNLSAFISELVKKDTTKEKDSLPWKFDIYGIELRNSAFKLRNFQPNKKDYLNFSDLDLKDLNIRISNFRIPNDSIMFNLEELNAKDKSGFHLKNLSGNALIHSTTISFTNLNIRTPNSNLNMPEFYLRHENYKDYNDFLNKVIMIADIDSSKLSSKTLGFIVPSLGKIPLDIKLRGNVKGTVSNLKAKNLKVYYRDSTYLHTNISINGLPDQNQTFLMGDIKELYTTADNLEYFLSDLNKNEKINIPDNLKALEKINFEGNVTGLLNDMVLFGKIKSTLGEVSTDIGFKMLGNKNYAYKGEIITEKFNLGKFLGSEKTMGNLSLITRVDGKLNSDKQASAYTDAHIKSFEFNGYNYHDLTIKGELANNKYDGSIKSGDPNFNLNFLGHVDFSQKIPSVNFSAYVPKANLSKLNIDKEDSTSTLSFLLTANFTGKTFDDINGQVKIVNSVLRRKKQALRLKKFYMFTHNTDDRKIITLNSDYLDAELSSRYSQAIAINSLKNFLYNYFPVFNPDTSIVPLEFERDSIVNNNLDDINFDLTLKRADKIFKVFAPDIRIAHNSKIKMGYNIDDNSFLLTTNSKKIKLKDKEINNLNIKAFTEDSLFILDLNSNIKISNTLGFDQLKLKSKSYLNDALINIKWTNDTIDNIGPGNFNLHTNLSKSLQSIAAKTNILPSNIFIAGIPWALDSSALKLDSSYIYADNITLRNQDHTLNVNGAISSNPNDTLLVKMNDIDLSVINWFTSKLNYRFKGLINGKAQITGIYKEPIFSSDLKITDLTVNDSLIGEGIIYNNWNNNNKAVEMQFAIKNNNHEIIHLNGDYFPLKNKINFNLALRELKIHLLSPFTNKFLNKLNGEIYSDLSIIGDINSPKINGNLFLRKGKFRVNYTAVQYNSDAHFKIHNNNLHIERLELSDNNGEKAFVNGNITNTNFKDLKLDLQVNYNDLMVLNTQIQDNEQFYGKAFVSGNAIIQGSPEDLTLNIKTKTEENTRLFVPVSNSGQVSQTDFLTFVSSELDSLNTQLINEVEEKPSRMKLNIELQLTPEAIAQIIIDSKMGDIIKAQGSGDLTISLDQGDLSIFGDYVIEKGDYLFNLQNVLSKKFRIESGSTITWNKDPLDAEIDMLAVYSTKAPLDQIIISDQSGQYAKKTPVDCQIIMKGFLTAPNVKFGIDLPTSDSETKSLVQNMITSEEEMSKQFLSLLLIGSFISDQADPNPGSGGMGAQEGLATASELLSNQLSHWFSQISNDVDLGVNYRPGDDINQDEVELALSTQLLNDRVIFNGNVGVGGQNTTTPANDNNFAGEFTVEVKLNETGTVRLKSFNRSNEDMLYKNAEYTQGVGIFYRVDYNNLKDLLTKLRLKKAKDNDNNQ